MSNGPSSYPAAKFAGNRVARCFVASIFTAGVTLGLSSIFALVEPSRLPYSFLLVLVVSFAGAQIQERLRRLSMPM
jgi:hypothetical protein